MPHGDSESSRTGREVGLPVVVGYNGKTPSQVALAWGAGEAARRDARLTVVFAANYPGMNIDTAPGGLRDLDPGALEAAHEVTARGVAEALDRDPRLQVSGATEVTSPVRALVAAGDGAAVLVVGNRGRRPAAAALLSSVSFNVAAVASCPVIVVKPESDARVVGPAHRVVVGTDGSPDAALAVTFAADYATAAGATLEVVVCTGSDQAYGIDLHLLRAAADHIAQSVQEALTATHPGLSVVICVEAGAPEAALVRASTDAGLAVVGTRGRGAFRGWLLGSVSHAVIHGAACPVAVC